MPAYPANLGCISTLLGTQQQLKLPTNSEKPLRRLDTQAAAPGGYPGFSLLAAGFNPAEKFAPKPEIPPGKFWLFDRSLPRRYTTILWLTKLVKPKIADPRGADVKK